MKKLPKPILAEGEHTGHAHVLDGEVDVFETDENTRIFELSEKTKLNHQEHKTIELTPGQYESDRVVEFDHFEKEASKVQD